MIFFVIPTNFFIVLAIFLIIWTTHSDWDDWTDTPHYDTTHSDVPHADDHADTHGDWSNYPHTDYPQCFLAGTKISMANSSSKKVEDIEIGDRVLSFYNTKKPTSASVSKLFSRLADHYYLLKTENHEVNVTGEHPFYTGEGFKRIKEFSIGDKIYIFENGKLVPEKIVHKELIKKQVKIYNFKVEESQTYFANGFAVHNKPPEHGDWDDFSHDNSHSDIIVPHSNVAHANVDHSNVSHDNVAFSNVAHVNTAFSNVAHVNTAHSDVTYADTAHSDVTYADTAHSDVTHSDTTHSDVIHSDTTHSDTTHSDAPGTL